MASAYDLDEFEFIINCPICRDVLQDPRTLECGHTFCFKCLKQWFGQNASSPPGRIKCPTCNHMAVVPDKDINKLSKVYVIDDVLHQFKRQASIGTACQLCHDKENPKEGNIYCDSCDKVFCDSCQQRHNTRFASHKQVRLCDNQEKITGCSYHRNETLKHMCCTCNTLICTLCALDDGQKAVHKQHEIIPLNEAIGFCKGKISPQKPAINQKLIKKKAQLEEVTNLLDSVQKDAATTKDAISFLADDLIAMVQSWETEALQKLEDERKKCTDVWQQMSEKMKQSGAQLEKIVQDIDNVEKQRDVSIKVCVDVLKETQAVLADSSNNDRKLQGPIIKQRTGQSIIEEMKNKLTEVSMFETELLRRSIKIRPNTDYENVSLARKFENVFEISTIGNRANEVRSPIGVSFSTNNSAIVCEVENKRVSIFSSNEIVADGSTQFTRKLTVNGIMPKSAVMDEDGLLYVADTDLKAVLVFDQNGHKITSWGEKVLTYPRCLALMSNNRIVVGDRNKHQVFIFNRDGSLVCALGSKGDKSEEFQFIISVATDSKNRIIVADRELNLVKVFDSNGLLAFVIDPLNEDDYVRPRYCIELVGVATDRDDNIYVVLHGNHMVLKYDSDGKEVHPRPYLGRKDGIYCPSGVAISLNGFVAVVESSVSQKHAAFKIFRP